nr:prepilin-type N-terminal cleavage/methylation domain-containing protein [Sporosarcina jiandibaonis]
MIKQRPEARIGGTLVRTNNEKGITLVELLAVLVLVSLVSAIVITSFSIAHRHNVVETKKLKLQQEANYIISAVLQKHRDENTECYVLEVSADEHEIVFKDCNGKETILGDKFNYSLTHNAGIEENDSDEEIRIDPKENDLITTLIVTDRDNPNLDVAVDTVFTRYKSKTLSKFDEEEENENGN